ncbi:MAG: 23S rRNA (adenine(2503)-C(2))-methyltransferase RlmN [Clostridia bacterium]|nr:23S rRNA (adenine(2503)-C(2))-methyltransferase RlmN [Clostridia bacterium]
MATDILTMTYDEILSVVTDLGFPAFRAKQLYQWLNKGAQLSEMNNLPKAFKDALTENGYVVDLPKIEKKLVSQVDGTVKLLFSLSDGQYIESVVMKYEHGNTICVSCQAGCRMGCKFCASTLRGLSRNLTPSEIIGQIFMAQRSVGERISNIVMMGIGEPLDNYDNVIRFLRTVNREEGLNIGYRHISLSTCGLVDGIKKLEKEQLPITLSISLHNIDTEQRKTIMPITNKWSVEELLTACAEYFKATGRRISFEYTLIANENDSISQAEELAKGLKKFLRGMPIHVNLIPLNDVSERSFKKSSQKNVEAFKNRLNALGINATVRRRLGPDINASCGQLRLNAQEQ